MSDEDEDVEGAIRSFSRLARCHDDELRRYRASFLSPSCVVDEKRLARCRDILAEIARAIAFDDAARWGAIERAHAVFFPDWHAAPPSPAPMLAPIVVTAEPVALSPWASPSGDRGGSGSRRGKRAGKPLEPVGANAQTSDEARPPTGPVLPFVAAGDAAAADGWSLENWVALQGELRVDPSARPSVLARYHLADDAAYAKLDVAWRARLDRQPSLKARLAKLTAEYERWRAASKGPGQP